jgi:hypothetical protein
MGHRGPIFKAKVHQDCKGWNPITNKSVSQSIYTTYIAVNIMAENECILVHWRVKCRNLKEILRSSVHRIVFCGHSFETYLTADKAVLTGR